MKNFHQIGLLENHPSMNYYHVQPVVFAFFPLLGIAELQVERFTDLAEFKKCPVRLKSLVTQDVTLSYRCSIFKLHLSPE